MLFCILLAQSRLVYLMILERIYGLDALLSFSSEEIYTQGTISPLAHRPGACLCLVSPPSYLFNSHLNS